MAKYIVHFKTNPSAWPSDPAQVAAIWESALGAASQMLEQGLFEQILWVSNLEGYALLESASKAEAMQLIAGFFPMFSQELYEVTPHAEASKAIVAGAKAAAG